MAFQVQHCLETLKHELGGKLSSEISPIALCNEAGEYLVSMHGWAFLHRPPTTLGLTNAQSFVLLPADFARIVSLDFTNGLTQTVHATTMEDIQKRRTAQIVGASDLYYALSWVISASGPTLGTPVQRLEIWPTPTATVAGALTLWYSVGWVEVVKEIDPIALPPYMRPLYLAVLRAFASGYEDNEAANVDARLAALERGALCMSAKKRDRAQQPRLGIPGEQFTIDPWESGTVLDPS